MKLWEAMLKGAKMGPQTFSMFHRFKDNGSCALGAAALGSAFEYGQFRDVFPAVEMQTVSPCPCLRVSNRNNVGDIVIHLNDWHRWSREAIAEWVKTIEDPEPVPPKQETPEEEPIKEPVLISQESKELVCV